MILTEKILNEGTITAEAFATYLYNKCLKDKVKQHTDKLYSIIFILLFFFAKKESNSLLVCSFDLNSFHINSSLLKNL